MAVKAIKITLDEDEMKEWDAVKKRLGLKAEAEFVRYMCHQFYLAMEEGRHI